MLIKLSFLLLISEFFEIRGWMTRSISKSRTAIVSESYKNWVQPSRLSMSSTESDLAKKLPYPLKPDTQKVLLKWYFILKKLSDASKSAPMDELSRRTGVSLDALRSLIGMSNRMEQILIWSNMRLVHSIAISHQGNGVDLDDLIAEGVKGLRRAIDGFDPDRGFKFSTYAYPWIKEYIRLALASASPIKLPQHVYKLLVKVRGIRERLYVTLRRLPTDEDLAEEMGINIERLDIVRRAMSLEARINDGINRKDLELMPFEDEIKEPIKPQLMKTQLDHVESCEPPPSESMNSRDMRAAILQALSTLPEEEAIAIQTRLGLAYSSSASTKSSSPTKDSKMKDKNTSQVVQSSDDDDNNNNNNNHDENPILKPENIFDEEQLKTLYHKGVRRLRRRAADPRYPEVRALETIFRDFVMKPSQQQVDVALTSDF